MLDPKAYWEGVQATAAKAGAQLCPAQLGPEMSTERLPGGCTLYRVEWPAPRPADGGTNGMRRRADDKTA